VFPALRDFAQVDGQTQTWKELADSGLRLLSQARLGRFGLPPDWLTLGDPPAPSERFKPRFGYDAVRIPLYLVWGRQSSETLRPFLNFWGGYGNFTPAWTSLKENCIDGEGAPAGMRSIKSLVQRALGFSAERFPEMGAGQDYYSASLLLLSRLAGMEAL
jgi:endoglucanase